MRPKEGSVNHRFAFSVRSLTRTTLGRIVEMVYATAPRPPLKAGPCRKLYKQQIGDYSSDSNERGLRLLEGFRPFEKE